MATQDYILGVSVFAVSLLTLIIVHTTPARATEEVAKQANNRQVIAANSKSTQASTVGKKSKEITNREDFLKLYRDPINPDRMVLNPVTKRPFTIEEVNEIWKRHKNLDRDNAYRQITLLSKPSSETVITNNGKPSLFTTPKSEQDINNLLRFFNDFVKIDWRNQKKIERMGPSALKHLEGMNRSRFSTAIANISKLEIKSMTNLLDSNPKVSLGALQKFFRLDERVLGYVIARTPGSEAMLESLGGVKTVSYTVGLMDNKEMGKLLDSIEVKNFKALSNVE